MNTTEGNKCIQDAFPWSPNLDLQWYHHFFRRLVATSETTVTETAPANSDAPSQIFIAFDLEEETMMVKFYFLPSWKAASLSDSNAALAVESILSLPGLTHGLKTSLGVMVSYISSFPAEFEPQVEIVAVDCLEPRQSRIKVYVRFQQTSFESMIDAMSLGGALPSFPPSILQDLKDLWCSCFGIDQTSSLDENIQHRTAGLLYYYELRENRPLPTSKVYLPVRHYASDDDQVARGVSDFLWKRGMTLKGGLSYYEGLSQLW
jgi:DMATS type aromatic prenyltransferase